MLWSRLVLCISLILSASNILGMLGEWGIWGYVWLATLCAALDLGTFYFVAAGSPRRSLEPPGHDEEDDPLTFSRCRSLISM